MCQVHKLFLKMVSNLTDQTPFSTCCTPLQLQTEMYKPKYARLRFIFCYFYLPTWDTKRTFCESEMLDTYFFAIYYGAIISSPVCVSPSTPRLYFTLSRKAAKPQLHTLILAIFTVTCIFLVQEISFKTEMTFLHILLYRTGTKKYLVL